MIAKLIVLTTITTPHNSYIKTHTYIHIHTYTYIYIYIKYTHTHVYIYIYIYIYIYLYTYPYIFPKFTSPLYSIGLPHCTLAAFPNSRTPFQYLSPIPGRDIIAFSPSATVSERSCHKLLAHTPPTTLRAATCKTLHNPLSANKKDDCLCLTQRTQTTHKAAVKSKPNFNN